MPAALSEQRSRLATSSKISRAKLMARMECPVRIWVLASFKRRSNRD
jgi:hypothetical protein